VFGDYARNELSAGRVNSVDGVNGGFYRKRSNTHFRIDEVDFVEVLDFLPKTVFE